MAERAGKSTQTAHEKAREAGWGRKTEKTFTTRPAAPAAIPPKGKDQKARGGDRDKRREQPEAKRITRSDTIADRRGRAIPVTRTRTEKPERPAIKKHRGKPRRPDRSRGPRCSRPR